MNIKRVIVSFLLIVLIGTSLSLNSQFRIFDDMYGLKSSSSPHFNYIYKDEVSSLIPETASIAEALYDTLSRIMGTTPMSKINLLITDQSDITNGLATPLLNPTVNIYLSFPDQSFTSKNYDWTAFVLSHELTHIFQTTSVNPKFLKACNNNILYLGYSGLPSYMLEGLAVYNESSLQKGRLHDTHFESILRTMIIDSSVQPLDRATAYFNRNWPFSTLSYLYGSYIIDAYINDFNTPLTKFSQTDCCACLPYTWLLPDAAYFLSTGALPNDVLKSVIEKASSRADIVVSGNQISERFNLDEGAYDNSSPLSLSGNLYYVKSFDYMNNSIVLYNSDGRKSIVPVAFTNGLKGSNGKIYYDDIEVYSGVDYFFDIYELIPDTKQKRMLKNTRRGMYPSVNGNEMFFVRNSSVSQQIIRYDIARQASVDSIPVDPSWRIFSTSLSADGRLLATVYRKGGFTDIAMIDFNTGDFDFLTTDTCTDFRPEWSSMKNGFYFISDRGGVNRVYFYSLSDTTIETVYSSNYYVYDYSMSSDEDSIYVQDISKDGNSIYAAPVLYDTDKVKVTLDSYNPPHSLGKDVRLSESPLYLPKFSGFGVYGFLPYAYSLYDTLTNDTADTYELTSAFYNADDAQMLSYLIFFNPAVEYVRPDGYTFFKYSLNLQTVLYCFPRDVEMSFFISRQSNTKGISPEAFEFFISPEFSISKVEYYAFLAPAFQISNSLYSIGLSAGISSYESGMMSIAPSDGFSLGLFPFLRSNISAGVVYSFSLYSKPFLNSVASLSMSGSVSTSNDISTRPVTTDIYGILSPMNMVYKEIGFDSIDSMSDFSFVRGTITSPILYMNRGIPIPLLISSAIRFDCLSSDLSVTYSKSFSSSRTDLILSEKISLNSLAYGTLKIVPSVYFSYSIYRETSSYGVNLSVN